MNNLLPEKKEWKEFIVNGKEVKNVRSVILDSWRRCVNKNVDYTTIPPLDQSIDLIRLLEENRFLLNAIFTYRQQIIDYTCEKDFIFIVANRDGIVIDGRGDKKILDKAKNTNLIVGSKRSEEATGTNAISLVLKEKKPMQVVGSEHYNQNFHEWSCSAAPIFDSNKELVGVINFSAEYKNSHFHTLALITTLAKMIEKEYQDSIDQIKRKKRLESSNINTFTFNDIIGNSPSITNAIKTAKVVSPTDTRILIEGESGTGKELFVQAIHNASDRNSQPFVAINCGSIPKDLMESELFGYADGAFTGAKKGGNPGKFELANNGTLFLDEINSMPMEMQIKLLRVLQQNEVIRIGSNKSIPINVRVISASNESLQTLIHQNKFRQDLYYRLSVFEIKLPALHERIEDIPLLFEQLLEKHSKKLNMPYSGYNENLLPALSAYDWPGNIRELENYVERALILSQGGQIKLEYFPSNIKNILQATNNHSLPSLKKVEKDMINSALNNFNWNITKAAKMLGITRNTLYKKIKEYNIEDLSVR